MRLKNTSKYDLKRQDEIDTIISRRPFGIVQQQNSMINQYSSMKKPFTNANIQQNIQRYHICFHCYIF